jgi:uncharacterized membrane protein YhaH (DUF805 family)
MEKSATQWMVEPLKKYASFSGRARRAEYWWYALFVGLISVVLGVVDTVIMGVGSMENYGIGPLTGLFALAIFLPSIGVTFRRLHDLDRSAWWVLLGLLPIIGSLVLLFWYVQRGTVGDNRFGPDPIGD